MNIKENLKRIRKDLLVEIDKVDSPMSLYNVQYKIACEIMNAESNYSDTFLGEYREHVLLLRNYGDTLPWRILNPYTIQELYNGEKPLQFLNTQKDAILNILEKAKIYAENGNVVLIGAVTNFINTADLLICDMIEQPIIIQCQHKHMCENVIDLNSAKQEHQLKKLNSTKYVRNLKSDAIKKYINAVKYDCENNWALVNDVVKNSIENSQCYGIIDKDDMIWAFQYNGHMPEIPTLISDNIKKYKLPVVGSHFRVLDEPELMINPPSCWPIELECRFSLMEGDIALMHYIDAYSFKKMNKPQCFIKDILYHDGKLEENCIVVESNKKEKVYSCKIINNVVYGFCTINEMANIIIEYADMT